MNQRKELSILKESKLNFKLHIEGTRSEPEVKLSFDLGGIYLSLPGTISEGVALVNVPKMPFLESLMDGDSEVFAKLEVVVEGQYFVPWKDHITLKKDIRIVAEEDSVELQSEQITVSALEEPSITKKLDSKMVTERLTRIKKSEEL